MEKKKPDSLLKKFNKQQIAQLSKIKGRSIDYACARGVVGGDSGGASHTCGHSRCPCTIA